MQGVDDMKDALLIDYEIVNYLTQLMEDMRFGVIVVWQNPIDKKPCYWHGLNYCSDAFKNVSYDLCLMAKHINSKQYKILRKEVTNTIEPFDSAKVDIALSAFDGFMDFMCVDYAILYEHLKEVSSDNDIGNVLHCVAATEGFSDEAYKHALSEAVEHLSDVVQAHNKRRRKKSGKIKLFTKPKRG